MDYERVEKLDHLFDTDICRWRPSRDRLAVRKAFSAVDPDTEREQKALIDLFERYARELSDFLRASSEKS